MAASVANNGRPSAAAVDGFQRGVREAALILIGDEDDQEEQQQLSLAELFLILTMVPSLQLQDAMRLLHDADTRDVFFLGDPLLFDGFRRSIYLSVLNLLQETRYDERMVAQAFPDLVLRAARQAAGLIARDEETTYTQGVSSDAVFAHLEQALGIAQPYPNGGFGAVPASAAAVRSLERQTFHAAGGSDRESVANGGSGITECSICFDEFVDGAVVTVMPCASGGHRFHPYCIAKWLGISNVCPLCRHQLPPLSSVYDQ